jgi:hypothetical protein
MAVSLLSLLNKSSSIIEVMRKEGLFAAERFIPKEESSDIFYVGLRLIIDGTNYDAIRSQLIKRSSRSFTDFAKLHLINFIYKEFWNNSMKIYTTVFPSSAFVSSPSISEDEARELAPSFLFNKYNKFNNRVWYYSEGDGTIGLKAMSTSNVNFEFRWDVKGNYTKYLYASIPYKGKFIPKSSSSKLSFDTLVDIVDSSDVAEFNIKMDSIVELH